MQQSTTPAKKKKIIKIAAIAGSVVAVLVAFLIVLNSVIIPLGKYKKALAAVDAENYSEAYAILKELGNFKDSKEQIAIAQEKEKEGKYQKALAAVDAENYSEAYAILKELGNFKDSKEQIAIAQEKEKEGKYQKALAAVAAGNLAEGYDLFVSLDGYKDCEEQASKLKKEHLYEVTKVGDIIEFGNYYQNSDAQKETVRWIVLEKKDGKVLLVSEKGLDYKPYNEEMTNVTWEFCTLRKWLNNEFLNTAFGEAEQNKIVVTTVTADRNPNYSTYTGNSTKDKVFILSVKEAKQYFTTDESMICATTAYAESHHVSLGHPNGNYSGGEENCYWWLRTQGIFGKNAVNVKSDGSINAAGGGVQHASDAIRPAIWINLA